MKVKPKTLFFILVLAATLLTACGSAPTTPTPAPVIDADAVIAEGHIIPRRDITLFFAVRGRVDRILVEEGQTVKKGDLLIRLADREQAEASLAAANLELTDAQQTFDAFMRTTDIHRAEAWQNYMQAQIERAKAERDWEKLNLDNIEDDIEDAQADVRKYQKELEDAQEEFDRYKDLDKDNAQRKQAKDDLEKAEEDYNEAVRKLEQIIRKRDEVRARLDAAIAAEAEAKRKYDLTKDGPDAEQLALLEARLNNAKAQVAAAQNALDNYDLKAPFDGVVTDVNLTPGEQVGPEKWAVKMADFSAWYIETSDLTELEVVKVFEGQRVEIVPDALPGLTLKGQVERIAQSYVAQSGDILYKVKIRLEDKDERLRWGMTVEVTFLTD
jgi:multidrug resistance efflux pump